MAARERRRHGGARVRAGIRGSVAAILACAVLGACDDPFEPFEVEQPAVFSMYGYLDVHADTQWVRVMPVRQSLLLDASPIDAVVTLRQVESGHVITLRDSLFSYHDPSLGGTGYAHNYWTTEPLDPGATYVLKAARSDGASSTAAVVVPRELELTFRNHNTVSAADDVGHLFITAEHLISIDVIHLMRDTDCGGSGFDFQAQRQKTRLLPGPPVFGFIVRSDSIPSPCPLDLRRHEIRVVAGPAGWPYNPELSDLDVAHPNSATSNVSDGLGFVGGVAIRNIPFHRCDVMRLRAGRDHYRSCEFSYDRQSASVAGRVVRQPCGAPHPVADVRLVEHFDDGGVLVRRWKTGPEGEYRFEGLEPGARRVLEVRPGVVAAEIPSLGPGERFEVEDIRVPGGC